MKPSRHGFSLVEVLVVLAVFSIVGGAILMTLLSAQRTWASGSGQAVVASQLRSVLDRMGWELAQSSASRIQWPWYGGSDSRITFQVPFDRNKNGTIDLDSSGKVVDSEWSDPITYRPGLARSSNVPVLFKQGGGSPEPEVLANRISRITFSRASYSDVVNITIGTFVVTERGQYVERLMTHRVKLRNS